MPAQPQPSLDELQSRIRPVLAAEPAIAAAYVFGSVARGEAGPESDLDVALLYRTGEPEAERGRIAARIAGPLARVSGVDVVDVVDLEAQGPVFAHRVLCEGLRAYTADRERRVDFESDTIVRALDFRPTHDLATRGKATAMRRWLRKRYDLGADPVEARSTEDEPRETG